MANPDHLEIVKHGAAAILEWREKISGRRLDLSEADLSNTDLRGADLSGAHLGGANLSAAFLFAAHLSGIDLTAAHLGGADLRRAHLRQAELRGADLSGADLGEADLSGAILYAAILHGANLREANLSMADLSKASLGKADLFEASLFGANLDSVQGAEHTYHLETVRLIPAEDIRASAFGNDAHHFATCYRPWLERWLDWEHLQVVGRLPLFGISYTALILIPIIFYGLALYNDKIDLVRTWAEQIVALHDHPVHRIASLILDRLYPRPIPSLSLVVLVSTVVLAAGSTLYTFFCPSRIKEFSRDEWCDQLGRSLLHYWPLAWKHRYMRFACAACYALGGAGALWVLGTKVWQTALFILKHSTLPWPWK